MSDFLDNLVTRSFSRTSIVRPRLPSRFEPAPFGGAYGIEQHLDFGATEYDESDGETATNLLTKREPITAQSEPHANMSRHARRASSRRPEASRDETAIRQTEEAAENLERLSPGTTTTQPPSISAPPTPNNSSPTNAPERREQFLQNSRTETLNVTTKERNTSLPRGSQQENKPALERRIRAEVNTAVAQEGELRPSIAGRTTARARVVTRPHAPSHEPSQTTPMTGVAPTIHVTINRVEVRAVMPSAPRIVANSTARRTATLSLDDYLKRRAGEDGKGL